MAGTTDTGGGRRAMTDINVTPLVDVMLVLLIIFMVTAPLIQSGVKVDLPRASAQQMEHEEEKLVLTITRDRRLFLGTTAAAAPFVGLFGTVWGIMGAFRDIYAAGNANLATVARPISEALIATAVGLFAAIPALVAYNAFNSRIRVLDNEMRNFSSDFLNIIKRHIFKKAA